MFDFMPLRPSQSTKNAADIRSEQLPALAPVEEFLVKSYSRSHLSDGTLLSNLVSRISQERHTTAELLADIGEVDERRLYAPAGYSSMFAYCVQELRLSEDSAYKRIQVARTARSFPVIFGAVAEGRLHLSGAVLLAPHLTTANAAELLEQATYKSKREIEQLLAQHFPRPELPVLVQALPAHAGPRPGEDHASQLAPGHVGSQLEDKIPGRISTPECPRPKISPLAPERYALQLTIGQSAHDKLRYVQELLGHQVPSGDLGEVLERVLDLAISQLQKRKFAATSRPRDESPTKSSRRDIPASVQRAVWQRDSGQCTFVSVSGRRCAARARLEFDHIQEVARGGTSTISNLRLLCRTHNQYCAERTYGRELMRGKREDAARAAAKKRVEEVIPYLRALGCRPDEARRAAERSEAIPRASLEERVRLAVSHLGPRGYSPSGGLLRARRDTPAAAAPA
jgi:hypothetical protein